MSSRPNSFGGASNNTGFASSGGGSNTTCAKCLEYPAAGHTLRKCSGCLWAKYCSDVCQQADWSDHKPICKFYRAEREIRLAQRVAQGKTPDSANSDMKRESSAVQNWYNADPGLADKVEFLAWKYRSESPVIQVWAPAISPPHSAPTVVAITRTQWDDVTSDFPESLKLNVRTMFAQSSFCADKSFHSLVSIESIQFSALRNQSFSPFITTLHSSALTLTADDFAAEVARRRVNSTSSHVRLTGLCGAAHLNGREGVLNGHDPNNSERFIVLLEGGRDISVQAKNYELVHRPKLFISEF
mmetsp:Transcript_35598/g.57194  ORF Transcript_35598/g.57194 Transcript_35598/m.57194 type:complete len:300 (-) Transcript_35598:64-963(-)